MKGKLKNNNFREEEKYNLEDFDLSKPEIIKKSLMVTPRYEGNLKMVKTSISLPHAIVDDLRHLARIKGMASYQSLLREFVSEKVFEEKKRLKI